jgi:nickel-dependent lactate racemase
MREYFLLGKDEKIAFKVPDTWEVLKNAVLEPERTDKTVYEMVEEAIETPIGTPPLNALIKPSDKIAIVLDDFTRPTPKKEMLTCLIDHLETYGIGYEQIDIVFGLGTHRKLTEEEVEKALGKKLMGKLRYTNHNAWAENLIPIGNLKSAGKVKINRIVAEADFKVTIGSIIPHPMNGFGGGAKLIMPGVTNYEAIRNHHNALMIAEGAYIGNIKGNPFREELCEAGRLAKLDFIINAVYNSMEQVKRVVAGDFEKAHELGSDMGLKEYAVPFDQNADVTIASTFPYDEGPQLIKPLGPATTVTKEGGTVILVAPAIQGGKLPDPLLQAFDKAFAVSGTDRKKFVLECLRDGNLIVPHAPMDFNCALDLALLYLSRIKVTFVSKDTDKEQTARLGFDYSRSLDEAIRKVEKGVPKARINILPSGGLIVPQVKKELSF